MTDEHIIVDPSIEDLKNGNALWVVLYPDAQQEEQPTIESYLLKHILISGNDFWGSFGSIHHSSSLHQVATLYEQDASQVNPSIPSAYAYSNRYEFVCNFSYLMGVVRCCTSRAYSKIHFRRHDNYRLIWSSGEPSAFDDLHGCVESGCQLKVSITDEQGLTLILPVHTPEVYLDEGRVHLLTEYDALPNTLRDEDAVKKINAGQIESAEKLRNSAGQGQKLNATTPLIGSQFDSTFYSINCFVDGTTTMFHWDINKREFIKKNVGVVQVFSEK